MWLQGSAVVCAVANESDRPWAFYTYKPNLVRFLADEKSEFSRNRLDSSRCPAVHPFSAEQDSD